MLGEQPLGEGGRRGHMPWPAEVKQGGIRRGCLFTALSGNGVGEEVEARGYMGGQGRKERKSIIVTTYLDYGARVEWLPWSSASAGASTPGPSMTSTAGGCNGVCCLLVFRTHETTECVCSCFILLYSIFP